MNNTSYFENVNVTAIKDECVSCIEKLRRLRKADYINVLSQNTSSNTQKLYYALKGNVEYINTVIIYLKDYVEVLCHAGLVKRYQEKMRSISNVELQQEYAKKIREEVYQLAINVKKLGPTPSKPKTNSDKLLITQEIKLRYTRLSEIKEKFDLYSTYMYKHYGEIWLLKSRVEKDEYLYYGWYKILTVFQELLSDRDEIDNWWTNYMYNMKKLENQLPTNTKYSEATVKARKYSGSSAYNGLSKDMPDYKKYVKSKQLGQIKSNEELAKEVWDGKWGDGDERKKKLEAAGYSYAGVQAIVNSTAYKYAPASSNNESSSSTNPSYYQDDSSTDNSSSSSKTDNGKTKPDDKSSKTKTDDSSNKYTADSQYNQAYTRWEQACDAAWDEASRKNDILAQKLFGMFSNKFENFFVDSEGWYFTLRDDDKKYRMSLPEGDAFARAWNNYLSIRDNPPKKP